MSQKTLDWAQRLRAELVDRTEGLRSALADMEPLREELHRLEGQLQGVERLILICHERLGYDAPPWASAARQEPTAPSSAPPIQHAAAPEVFSPPAPGPSIAAFHEARARVVRYTRAVAARSWSALQRWLGKEFPHQSA
jgi:hypothetical protein